MKVKEIRGYWDDMSNRSWGDLRYYAFYYAKIEDKYVIIERRLTTDHVIRGPILKYKLSDSITGIYACDDEKDLEERIQAIIQDKEKDGISRHFIDQLFFSPLEMQNGREIDLNLANIAVPRNSSNDQASYEYVIDKKREELLLDRLEQLQQTIKNNPEKYSVETYIEKYEQQSGKHLTKQQLSILKEFADKIQNGLILGKYNLEDYCTFLNSIPGLLSGKTVLGFGRFSSYDGKFIAEAISSMPSSVEDIALYNTYTYRTFSGRDKYQFTMDDFQVMPSPSIKTRMNQDGRYPIDKLYALKPLVRKHNGDFFAYKNLIWILEQPRLKDTFSPAWKSEWTDWKTEWTAADISAYLEETSRESLVTDGQAQLIELADKKPNERSEEQL